MIPSQAAPRPGVKQMDVIGIDCHATGLAGREFIGSLDAGQQPRATAVQLNQVLGTKDL